LGRSRQAAVVAVTGLFNHDVDPRTVASDGLNWMVGGPQGSGVDSAAQLFALSVARAGLHVVGQREYYSNIMGKHSYYKIRMSERPIGSPSAGVQLLATYDDETVVRHVHSGEVVKGGAVLHAGGDEDKEIRKVPFLDARVRDAVLQELEDEGLPATVAGVLETARRRGVHVLALPYDDFLEEVAKRLGRDSTAGLQILRNTCAVGASLGLLGLPADYVNETVAKTFAAKKGEVREMNIVAAQAAADFAVENLPGFGFRVGHGHDPGDRVWIQGTQAVALAKAVAGCRFHTYYPISPATDEATFLEANPESGIVVVQAEDEIAAATMAAGAAVAGARASTSTSGPGLCLMVEAIGWAGMNEVPLVVVDYMRGGPSTGLPTRTEQGDLQFALRMGHSDFPRIVVAPGDIEELFHDTVRAFDWAERYQTPVLVLPDKALAGNAMTMSPFDTSRVRLDRGRTATEEDLAASTDGRWPRFAFSDDGVSVRPVLGQKNGIHWLTGDEHTELGHISENPEGRDLMMGKRLRKLELAAQEIPEALKATLHGLADAELTLVAWGATKGAVLEAVEALAEQGTAVNFLQIRVMSPFPDIADILRAARRLVCLEENATGQLRDLIAERTGIRIPHVALKTNGRPTLPHEVVEAVRHVLDQDAPKVVMRHGV